jgi:hypothetical protein
MSKEKIAHQTPSAKSRPAAKEAEVPPAWNGAGRFRDDADPAAVLRATYESCHVVTGSVLEHAAERTLDELGVLELAFESDSEVFETRAFVERVRLGLAAALWLHKRDSQ